MREIWCFTIFSYLRLYSLSLSLPTLSNMFLFLQGDASSVGHGAVLNIVQEEEEASGCVLVKMHEGSRVEIFSFFTGVPHNCQWNPTLCSISSSITLCGRDWLPGVRTEQLHCWLDMICSGQSNVLYIYGPHLGVKQPRQRVSILVARSWMILHSESMGHVTSLPNVPNESCWKTHLRKDRGWGRICCGHLDPCHRNYWDACTLCLTIM